MRQSTKRKRADGVPRRPRIEPRRGRRGDLSSDLRRQIEKSLAWAEEWSERVAADPRARGYVDQDGERSR